MEERESIVSVFEIDESVLDEQKTKYLWIVIKSRLNNAAEDFIFLDWFKHEKHDHIFIKKSKLKQPIAIWYLVAPAPTRLLFQSR